MSSASLTLDALYAARFAAAEADARRLDTSSRRCSRARLAFAGLGVAALVVGSTSPAVTGAMTAVLVAASVISFLLVAWRHDRVERERLHAVSIARLCETAQARLARRWDALPPAEPSGLDTTLTTDLDLEGRASLRQLFGRTATPLGEARLTAWLHDATRGSADVVGRLAAVRELAPLLDVRLDLLATGLTEQGLRATSVATLQRWAHTAPSLLAHPALAAAWLVIPVAGVLLALLEAQGVRLGLGWLALAAASWALRGLLARWVGPAFAGADALSGEAAHYVALFARWEQLPVASPLLAAHQHALRPSGGLPASHALRRLGRLIDLADLRYSHLPHFFVHALTGWDLHVASALERWKRRHGQHVATWFEALSDLDALATMAGLAHDEPTWSDPVVDARLDRLAADDLAHPLLSPDVRAANSLAVGPAGSVLVVTGSNMSGKSTLLRAIGLNAVLAQMGAPVCAARFTLPPVRLATSMRLSDSLADGVSYFMAALLRIKAIVEVAEQSRGADDPRVLYLLDELLQGTNSDERQIAVRHIVGHLVLTDAVGAITTHDLNLVDAPEFVAHARHVHFTEQLHDEDGRARMTFDYLLRDGPATSRNALALVRLVGLGDAR